MSRSLLRCCVCMLRGLTHDLYFLQKKEHVWRGDREFKSRGEPQITWRHPNRIARRQLHCVSVCVRVTQLCLTLCDPMDCSPPGTSARGILQAKIPKRIAIPFSNYSMERRIKRIDLGSTSKYIDSRTAKKLFHSSAKLQSALYRSLE